MNRIQELIKELCPNGVEWKTLGEIGKISMCKRIMKNETSDSGDIPFYKIGSFGGIADSFISRDLFEKYKKTYSYPKKGEILLSASGTIGKSVIFDGSPSYFQDSNIVWISNDEKVVFNKYLYYYYQIAKWNISSGGTIARLYNDNLAKTPIQIPPLSVQTEIVRILDKFVEQQEQLEKLIELRTKQYEYYSHKAYSDLIEKGIKQKCLGEFCDLLSGNPFDSNLMANNGIRLMRGMNIKRGVLDFSEDLNKYWHTDKGLEKFYLNKNDIVISMDGSLVGRSFAYIEEKHLPLLLVQRVARIRMKNDNPKFLYHYLANGYFADYVDLKKTAGAIPHISMKDISSFQIPLPDIDTQKRIADALDNFESSISALTSALELSKKRYEHYRDEMLKF